VLWEYLIVVDPSFNILNLSSLLGLVVVGLALGAGVDAIKALKEQRPNRHLLQHQKAATVPQRQPASTIEANDTDDNETAQDVEK
jgi:hypothetical protein